MSRVFETAVCCKQKRQNTKSWLGKCFGKLNFYIFIAKKGSSLKKGKGGQRKGTEEKKRKRFRDMAKVANYMQNICEV